MINKEAVNNIREKGFDTRSQMRYLLRMAKEYPEDYSWVFDALRDHGVPKTEGPLQTHWKGPYNKSPETPSYTYVSRASSISKLTRIAQGFDNLGRVRTAQQLDDLVLKSFMIDHDAARKAANSFWTINVGRKESLNQERTQELLNKLEQFLSHKEFDEATKTEVRNKISDKMMGREA